MPGLPAMSCLVQGRIVCNEIYNAMSSMHFVMQYRVIDKAAQPACVGLGNIAAVSQHCSSGIHR